MASASSAPRPRLHRGQLERLRREGAHTVDVPAEALLDLPELAAQFGTGGFLRGFVDDFIHRANQQGTFGGRIVAIGSTGSDRLRTLRDQDGLYTLVVEGIQNGQQVQECRIISSLSRALSATDEWPDVLALARAPQLQYVFSNTTEVGIATDLSDKADDMPPRSFPAKLTRFLYERAQAFEFDRAKGLTIIPCELIEDNGARLRGIVLELATHWSLGSTFTEWVETAVPFCNTLVDRIVPGAPRAEENERWSATLGYGDALLTSCEPYRLFAIEGDETLKARLTWAPADAGIIIAPDIAPYRKRKVHLLNGAHSLLVNVALPMGCETVRDAVSQPALGRFLRHAMFEEIVPMLQVEAAEEFAAAVLDRFQNPFIRHALVDITLQATMKMRVRVVPMIERYIATTGRVPQSLAFGFAAFLLFMQGRFQESRKERGLPVPADDQAPKLHALWRRAPEDQHAPVGDIVWEACRDVSLWGTDLTALPGFCEVVADHVWRLRAMGVSAALEHHLGTSV